MNIDDMLKNANRLQPPDTLKEKVMKAVANTPQERVDEVERPTVINYIDG